ncbi:ABC transporter permease [Chitinophaga sp. 22321]|uniref:ABC transporter permease n=1 Tax=Chitinophaga hostae TaxID=2831022 RepID=A0ABS5IY53_9BACT|nr:ABC transporter permease [Chitinophaga hostae]MBS0027778.1 ABC transporter permease [Chitinophaga hostae]
MISNYFRITWRNLSRNKGFAVINILGLAIGMAVVILIGLWITDETSYNKSLKNYDRIVQVMHNWNNAAYHKISTETVMPIPAALELRSKYAAHFKHVALNRNSGPHVLAYGDKKINQDGLYGEPELMDILSPDIVSGTLHGLNDPSSVMLSRSVAQALFGAADPINKVLRIDNKNSVKVTGVFEDFPGNTNFSNVKFVLPWSYLIADQAWIKNSYDAWNNNSFFIYAELADHAILATVAGAVRDLLKGKPDRHDDPEIVLQPMSKWHLYGEFTNGKNTGGAIRYVWIFGTIGLFVLLLACINFMNLNTARSQKRAREVGIRKAIGSEKHQLIFQFLGEAMIIAGMALLLAMALAAFSLPWFNALAEKEIRFPWNSGTLWAEVISLTLLTGLLAGSYPAFYLSSFNTLKVLKGTFKTGRTPVFSRKALVVLQFTVSVVLIIGTIIIFKQIQHARNRPLGYDRNGLINIAMTTPELQQHYDALRNDLINSGGALNMAEASNPATELYAHLTGYDWPGKPADLRPTFATSWVSHDFGKTVDWRFTAGRDFSRAFATDTFGMILNESAVAFMGLEHPVGSTIKFDDNNYQVIGVIKNVIMESPFAHPAPAIFMMDYGNLSQITVRINPLIGTPEALAKIETVLKKYAPTAPFKFSFADLEYARKFSSEDRISKLSAFFALFAIFISCLGIFGLATFTAEQRVKEIGIRKVLGASVVSVWALLTKEFLLLTAISFSVAMPVAWYFMHNWLQQYDYRIGLSVWIFVITALVTLVVTLGTVSFQAIRAALINPVNSLRAE